MHSLPLHSPAELLLVLHQRHSPNLRQLLRLTFLDLLRQQVLAVSHDPSQPNPRDPVTWQQYIISGLALHAHQVLAHERLLISAFQVDDQLRVPFKQYVRMIFEKASTASEYYKLIQTNTRTGQLFLQHWFRQLIGYRSLTPIGKQLRAATEAELVRLDKELATRTASSTTNTHQFTQQLGGALFLLPSFSSEMVRQLEQELHQIPESTYSIDGDFGSSDDGGTSWHAHGDTFDGHCSSHDSSDGSGSGSDSGCGGDSGCSGCGGCSSD